MVDFESILAPKWRPNGTQHAPKTISKINQKNDWIFDRFLEARGGAHRFRDRTRIEQVEREKVGVGPPPPPQKLLAKAKSDLKSSDMKIEDMKI